MKITVIGATGMVGSRIVAEAIGRGHQVVGASRSGSAVPGAERASIELSDTNKVVAAIENSDGTVIAVPPSRTGDSHEPTLKAHRALIEAAPGGRFLVVGGAGALSVGDSLLKDTPTFPTEYKAEADTFATVLDLYRGAPDDVEWTMLAPAPLIAPGERSGTYRVERDTPAGDSISAEDFAVAALDELEKPAHSRQRFTVAN